MSNGPYREDGGTVSRIDELELKIEKMSIQFRSIYFLFAWALLFIAVACFFSLLLMKATVNNLKEHIEATECNIEAIEDFYNEKAEDIAYTKDIINGGSFMHDADRKMRSGTITSGR